MEAERNTAAPLAKRGPLFYLRRDAFLYGLLILPIAYFVIFKYVPMYGVTIAFKEFNIFKGVWGSPWIGFEAFREIFAMKEFYRALRNTFLLNGLDILVGFPVPIALAILLNELSARTFKRLAQTILYIPHFLSWVIIAGITLQVFAPTNGIINNLLRAAGMEPIPFLTSGPHWIATYIGIGIWQNMGWGSIIYLAAITGINPELYEAAEVDGAGRFRRIRHVTLPGIKSTIVILLILAVGRIAMIGFDRPFLIGNQMVFDQYDVISTFVYRVGLQSQRYTIATAVGLFQSVVGLAFLLATNAVAKRSGESGIW
jgi:putative aldouronate transport system permease protein